MIKRPSPKQGRRPDAPDIAKLRASRLLVVDITCLGTACHHGTLPELAGHPRHLTPIGITRREGLQVKPRLPDRASGARARRR